MSSPTQLVCFDLGRVLIRICDDWRHACEVAGLPFANELAQLDKTALVEIEEIVGRFDSGAIDLQTFAKLIAPYRGLNTADVIRIQDVYLRGPYPGVPELIDDLSRRRIHTACLSNTTDNHWQMMLDASGPNFLPLEKMTWRFASHLIGARKPDPKIYEHVEQITKLPPESILFFDDLEENVAAARARGWLGHRVTPGDDPVSQIRSVLRGANLL